MSTLRIVSTLSMMAAAAFVMEAGQPETKGAEAYSVKFRLNTARSAHFEDPRTAEQFAEGLKRIGVSVDLRDHGNHLDVVYRCPEWRTVEASTDEGAHRWENWLRKQGFETMHRH